MFKSPAAKNCSTIPYVFSAVPVGGAVCPNTWPTEMGVGVGGGDGFVPAGVGVGVGVLVGPGVVIGVGVGVAVGPAVGVCVADGVRVTVFVGVGVGLDSDLALRQLPLLSSSKSSSLPQPLLPSWSPLSQPPVLPILSWLSPPLAFSRPSGSDWDLP